MGGQSCVLLAWWQRTGASFRGPRLQCGEPWQCLEGEQSGQAVLCCATPFQIDPRGCTWDMRVSASPGQHWGQLGWLEAGGSFWKRV